MSRIVKNKDTGIEYTVVYSRYDKVVLSRRCSMGFLNISDKEFKEKFIDVEKFNKVPKVEAKSNLSLEDLQIMLTKEYKLLENLKNNFPDKSDEIKNSELKLKDITLKINRLVKNLLSMDYK